jgi:nucleoside-diphosphate-sugar epimerase
MPECILVTGGSGFIGAYLLKTLAERGEDVINYDVSPPSSGLQKMLGEVKDKVVFVKGNILDLPTLFSVVKDRDVQRIVHMAALFYPQESIQIPYYTHQVNVVGTLNALEAARIFALKRIVLVSTIGLYPQKLYEPMDEKHPILIPGTAHPHHYGASKAAAEIMGLAYWRNNGVNFVGLRFSGVFGFGMRYSMFIKDMIENSLQAKPTKFTTGGTLCRDYTYVMDSVNALLCALEADDTKLAQRVYLTTSGELYSGSDIARVVSEIIPNAQIEIGSGLSDYEKKDAARRGVLDISAAKEELGYVPRFKLREAIKDYIQMFKKWNT